MSFWTEENIAELRRLAPNHTASQIAAIMGAPSRNVIIGKLHRMKLALNPDRPRGQARPKIRLGSSAAERRPVKSVVAGSIPARDSRQAPQKPAHAALHTLPLSTIGGRYQCDLVHLSATACLFPCWGDATPTGERRYCGAMAIEGMPYCGHHSAIAFSGPMA